MGMVLFTSGTNEFHYFPQKLLIAKDTETAVMLVNGWGNKDQLLDTIRKLWNDLWKDSVEKEIFLNFFFEVQCGLVSSTLTT